MKIALCISGQPRGIPLSCTFLNKNVVEPNGDIDIFLHAWYDSKDAGKPYSSAQQYGVGTTGFIKDGTDEFLVEIYKPKKHIIEPQRDFTHLNLPNSDSSARQDQLASNFYSVYMANELKKQYEQEHGIKYDVVIRTRYDLFYHEPIKVLDYKDHLDKIVVMEEFQGHQDAKNNSDLPMVDIFSFSSSENMDIFSGVYPNIEELNKVVNPPFGENILGHHVRVNNKLELFKAPLKFQIMHRLFDLSKI